MRKRKKHVSVLERRADGWYENGVKLQKEDYAMCFNSQHGNSIVSWITNTRYSLDSRFRPI